MSRTMELVFRVPEEAVGGIIADMEGRHSGVSVGVVEVVDGRSKVKGQRKYKGADVKILEFIQAAKANVSRAQIASAVGLKAFNVTYYLRELEKDKLIKRAPGRTWKSA